MSEENTTQASETPQPAEGTRSPVEKQVSQEVAPKSQDKDIELPDYGALVQESKKYRARAQKSEQELVALQKKIDANRQKQMEEQNKWQELAEQRGVKLQEQEPVIEAAMKQLESMREEILADMSEEDRETFGDLPLDKLKVLHNKLNVQIKDEEE